MTELTATTGGHNPGTKPPDTRVNGGRQRRDTAHQAVVPALLKASVMAWPRLLSIEQASAYLSLSVWSFREYVNDGSIRAIPLPRPETLRQKERHALGESLRRLLFDRNDLDELIEAWKRRA